MAVGVSINATLIYRAIRTRQSNQRIIIKANSLHVLALRGDLTVFMELKILRRAKVKPDKSMNQKSSDEQINNDVW